jgi:hypothetical protein
MKVLKRVFSDYFYTSQEIRKMKLIKLNERITE